MAYIKIEEFGENFKLKCIAEFNRSCEHDFPK